MKGRSSPGQPRRLQRRTARGSGRGARPLPSKRPGKHQGQAVHSGRTPRSHDGQISGARVSSEKEFSPLPHQGQCDISSAMAPEQRWHW